MIANKQFQKLTIIIGILVAIIIGISLTGMVTSEKTAQTPFSLILKKTQTAEFSKIKGYTSKMLQKMKNQY